MLHRREFVFLLLFAAAVLLAFLWPAAKVAPRSSLPATAGIESADPNTDITGVVVDSEGRPVAEALITSDIHPFGRAPYFALDPMRPDVEGPSTVTAGDGTFVLPVGHGEIADLCVRPREHGEAMTSWRRPGDHLRIVVTDGADVVVTVLDQAGKPVPDVRVFLLTLRCFEEFTHWHSGVTREDGRHVFRKLSAGLALVTLEPRWAGGFANCTIPPRGREEITLRRSVDPWEEEVPVRGALSEGRVLDQDGSPLAGARVATADEFIWTDSDGGFRIHLGKKTPLAIWSPGCGRVTEMADPWRGVREFRLVPGHAITGVLLGEAGQPVANVEVYVIQISREGMEMSLTDSRGEFRFADMAPGEFGLFSRGGITGRITVPADGKFPRAVLRTGR